jgi:hypothetical protein
METLIYKEILIKWLKGYPTAGKHSRKRTVISAIQLEAFAGAFMNAHYNSETKSKYKKKKIKLAKIA